jgi:hypothetical protein
MSVEEDGRDGRASVQTTVWRCVDHPSLWAAPLRFVDGLIQNLPTYRDTRSGRQKRNQLRAVLMIAGVIVATLAAREYLPAGIALVLCARVLPVEEGRKRTLISKVRTGRKNRTRVVTSAVSVHITESALEVYEGKDRRHRIRWNKIKPKRESRGQLEAVEVQRKPVRVSLLRSQLPKSKVQVALLADMWKKSGREFILADDDLLEIVLQRTEEHEV